MQLLWLIVVVLIVLDVGDAQQNTGMVIKDAPKVTGYTLGTSPLMIPAIEVSADSYPYNDVKCSPMAACTSSLHMVCSNGGHFQNEGPGFMSGPCVGGHVPSCADKSRILLTAEDGKRWCLSTSFSTPLTQRR